MAAATSDHRDTTLLVTDSESGELVARRWIVEVVSGPDAGKSIERAGGTIVVGSHSEADLTLSDPSVSRYHAELRLLPEGVLALDLGSKNGMRVGSSRVERALIPAGGTVRLGRTELKVSPRDDEVAVGDDPEAFGGFLTAAKSCRKVLAQLRLVARTEATILLQGETGTGKELLARAIHDHSQRAGGPFVVVDCGAVTKTLLESQLFGHVKGAFTGAVESRAGAFEAADHGTVVLDELGELPLDLQPKLLRVLEARTVRRVGDVEDKPVDVRFVASTNRDLEAMVRAGEFREDLFYRVAVVRAKVPPLRERLEDVPLLALHSAKRLGGDGVRLTDEAQAVLSSYDWPGNARELRNVIERAVALKKGSLIEPKDLFPEEDLKQHTFHEAKDQVIAEFERRYVKALLARHQGNVSGAAREAGLSRNALYALMKRSGLE
jgi:transcriptional regulator with PAS, ATPase and Fis domain